MLLHVPNVRQRQPADCLTACAVMVLAYLNLPADYERIRRILGTTEIGTPFSHLELLRFQSLDVIVAAGDLEFLGMCLTQQTPVIVDVQTWALPYWQSRLDISPLERDTSHAVVVVGLDSRNLYVNDPDIEHSPQAVPLNAFLAAWLERDLRCAVIQPAG
jgi:ABC-type bacteriocin/lantibiotic exporter with double-glycine peptidase domain